MSDEAKARSMISLDEVDTDPDPESEYETIDRSPTTISTIFAIVAGAIAVITSAIGGIGVFVTLPSLFIVIAALSRGSRRYVVIGAAFLFIGNSISAVSGSPIFALVGAAASVLVWDLGENAISIGNQLGKNADTRHLETTHAAASIIVGVVGVAAGFFVYNMGSGGRPIAALIFLLLAVIALTTALRS